MEPLAQLAVMVEEGLAVLLVTTLAETTAAVAQVDQQTPVVPVVELVRQALLELFGVEVDHILLLE